jgi:hypothetical protein
LKQQLGDLFGLEYDLLLYDVTSTYFEASVKTTLWLSVDIPETNDLTANRYA